MKKFMLQSLTILFFFLSYSLMAPAQCKRTKNPNKWLYKPGIKRIKIDNPSSVDKASKQLNLVATFGFEHASGMFCIAKSKEQNYLWFLATVKYNKDWNVKKNDPMTVYFGNEDSMRLEPASDYDGKRSGLSPSTTVICFYPLSKEHLEYISKHTISKISMQITSVPAKAETEKDIPEYEAYTFPVSEHASRKLQQYSNCFLKEMK